MKGKNILITGAFGALGSATAIAASARGARVALIGHAGHASRALIDACGARAVVLTDIDLTKPEDATRAVTAAHEQMGGLDVVINIAGGFRWQTVADGDPATWDQMFAINLKTALNTSRAAIACLRQSKAGRIINIGANSAEHGASGMGPYTASKAAVHRLTESLAAELKASGITVNAVLPSIIDTPANRADMPKADHSKWVSPQALSEVILFLASDEASAVTGALLPVVGRV
jgi:NAD(P)-dependent dehydrogenase (short-subunit alcohol dehydrogenase family)